MGDAYELVCERDCGYNVSSMTPNAGYQRFDTCPRCGGDLEQVNT